MRVCCYLNPGMSSLLDIERSPLLPLPYAPSLTHSLFLSIIYNLSHTLAQHTIYPLPTFGNALSALSSGGEKKRKNETTWGLLLPSVPYNIIVKLLRYMPKLNQFRCGGFGSRRNGFWGIFAAVCCCGWWALAWVFACLTGVVCF